MCVSMCITLSELEETLVVLPFHFVVALLRLMKEFVEKSSDIELSQRLVGFLLRFVFSFYISYTVNDKNTAE